MKIKEFRKLLKNFSDNDELLIERKDFTDREKYFPVSGVRCTMLSTYLAPNGALLSAEDEPGCNSNPCIIVQ